MLKFVTQFSVSVMAGLTLTGCATIGTDSVVFLTKTSMGIDVDTKPPTLDIGYHRKEGTIAPVSEDGDVLPQMASFSSSNSFVNQSIGQSFSTGRAAEIFSRYLTSTTKYEDENKTITKDFITGNTSIKNSRNRQRYFFGTDTSFGFRVNMGMETGGIPDSLSIGYKRKEFAFVPLITSKSITPGESENVHLPSLLSTAGLDFTSNLSSSELEYNQFFATGRAANYLAAQPGVRISVARKLLSPDVAKEAEKAQQIEYRMQNAEKLQEDRQARVSALLRKVDNMDDAAAFSLSDNPPYLDKATERAIALRDPGCTRSKNNTCNGKIQPEDKQPANGDSARKAIKMRLVQGRRDDDVLKAWESAIVAN